MTYRTTAALLLAALGTLLAGCNTRSDVSLTGNTPAQYSHVYLTTQAVWFNSSATAGPDDSGWVKFPLSTPTTVDLVTAAEGGTLTSLASDLRLLAGTYSQIRLIPVDASAALSTSAQTLGAQYNAEVDYVDSSGTTQQVPLELLNPDKGIGIQTSLRVPIGSTGSALGASTSTAGAFTTGTGDATSGTGTGDATGTGTTTASTGTGIGIGIGTGTGTTTTVASFAINIDGTRDLVPFTFGASAVKAMLLNSHATAYDLSTTGSIQGTLTLTNFSTLTSGLPAIQVDAETLSADGTRHVVVLSTTVNSSGDFTLYPLPTSSSTPAYYDVVIHGPGIATIIIKAVELIVNSTTSTTQPITDTTTSTTSTTDTTTAATATTSSANSISVISIGTFVPRAATNYSATISTAAGSPLPAGALVNFYQTVLSGDVPYVIEAGPIDPFNQTLSSAQALSLGTIDSGTYVATGETVNLVSAAPVEGAGHYKVAAIATGFSDGALSASVAPPASGTAPVNVPLAALAAASGSTLGSVAVVVTQASAGKYDKGQLLVSHEGTLIASAPLDTALTQGGTVAAAVPVGAPSSYYYVSVRVWNSSNPAGTLARQSFPTMLDLRSGGSASLPVTIN